MVDTRKITRTFEIKGIKVTISPYYEFDCFAGYTAAAGNTIQKYPLYLYRRFWKYTMTGIDERITAENIANDFIDYYYVTTRKTFLEE